jgi:DeoR/GlpR family transcriptional regulator of sugar metabolism
MVGGCIDASAVQAVAQFAFDRCFLGACALSPKTGVGAASVADATFKRAALAASRNSVALATADKFAAHAPYRVAPIKAIGHVVVEYEVSDAQCASLSKAGTSVVKAERPDSE